jgi:uncharacterized protein YecT (DUF1311 family)
MESEMFRSSAYALALMATYFPASAMDFQIRHNPEMGLKVIIAEGEIKEGDAERLEEVIPQADRDQYGNIPIYLNSPGGSVAAAFEMVRVMDRLEFSALVGSNAVCASACATILYVSARFHQVIGTGKLGIHTCYSKSANAAPEPSAICNHLIATNAYQHGTSYGAVNMWTSYAGPDGMAWIGKEGCEYGLCGPPGFDDTLAIPSFDCKKARLPSENAICADKRLARYEAAITKRYHAKLRTLATVEQAAFKQDQRRWLEVRNGCAVERLHDCLLSTMKERLAALTVAK